mgnify:CR=1 FL=1
MIETSEIWWRQITGARNFLNKVANALANGKSAVICLSEATPWLDDMREILREFLNKKFGGIKAVYEVNAASMELAPAIFVFENFCSEDIKSEFIPFGENAHVKFLAERDDITLNNACLWIRDATEQADSWYHFIADYHKALRGRRKGIFLLEANSDFSLTGKADIEIFSCAQEISDYDCYAFNIFIAAEFGKGDKFIKRYLAELVSNTTGLDVEKGAECIKCGGDFLKNPSKFLENKSREEIDRTIWTTQLKLLFPLLEIFRRDFVKKYEPLIEKLLPFEMSSGKKIDSPDEAELGDLYSILGGQNLPQNDWEDLKIYRDARNKLAHLSTLTLEEVQQIFN